MGQRATVLTICVLLTLTFNVFGQSCPEPVGHWGYGSHRAGAWYGELTVIASGPKLLVVDYRLGAPQAIVGELRLPGDAIALAVSGDIAYVGLNRESTSDDLLATIDLTQPTSPILLGHVAIAGDLSDVSVRGTVAYVTSFSEGLVLVDMSDPTRPRRISTLADADRPGSVVVRGDYAYMGNYDGLSVVEVATPTRPSLIARHHVAGNSVSLALSDDLLFFLSETTLTVFDLIVPESPTRRGSFELTGVATALDATGTTAHVTQRHAGTTYSMAIVDATNPLELQQIGSYDPGGLALDVAAAGGSVLLSLDMLGSQLVDVSDPTGSHLVAELPVPVRPGDIVDVAVDRGLAFLADYGTSARQVPFVGGLRILDVTGESGPTEVGSVDLATNGANVAVLGEYVLLTHWHDGSEIFNLDVIDTTEPENPTVVGSLELSGVPWGDIAVSGHHAFLTDTLLYIVDLSDPTQPTLVGQAYPSGLGGYTRGVAVDGDRAYLAATFGGFCVVDVSDPANPSEIVCAPSGRSSSGIAVRGDFVFVSVVKEESSPSWPGELRVFDVTDIMSPVEVGSLDLWGWPGRMTIDGDLLFVETSPRGLLVVDISNPAEPVAAGLAPLNQVSVGSGGRLYAAAGRQGFDVFDTTACSNPFPSPEFVWWPEEPTLGEEVVFNDISPGAPSSWSWDFGEGATSPDQHPRHTFSAPGRNRVTLSASNDSGTASSDLWVPVQSIADPMLRSWVIPAAAHGDGKADTRWRSDLVLSSSNATTEVILYLMKQGEDNTVRYGNRLTLQLGANAFDDVVATVFGEDETSGAIFVTSKYGIRISSKTYTLSDDGSFGQFIPAIDRRDSRQAWMLIQLTQDNDFRTNLGLVNQLGTPLSVEASLITSDNTRIAEEIYTVEPFGHLQVNEFIAELTDHPLHDGYVVLVGNAGAEFFAYASTVDNTTGDPAFILPPLVGEEPLWIPAVAHVAGRNGTLWRSDVEICASPSTDAEYRVEFFETDRSNPHPIADSFVLGAGQCARYADAVESVFHRSTTGALRIVPTIGIIFASSRTYTRRSDGGTYGQFIAAIPESDAILHPRQRQILQLSSSPDPAVDHRTNLGFVNTTAVPVEVNIYVHAQDEALLHEMKVDLAPFEHRQLNRFLERAGLDDLVNATVRVQSATPDSRFIAYGSVVDNESGDAVFLPAQ